jgi:hypothetical protein
MDVGRDALSRRGSVLRARPNSVSGRAARCLGARSTRRSGCAADRCRVRAGHRRAHARGSLRRGCRYRPGPRDDRRGGAAGRGIGQLERVVGLLARRRSPGGFGSLPVRDVRTVVPLDGSGACDEHRVRDAQPRRRVRPRRRGGRRSGRGRPAVAPVPAAAVRCDQGTPPGIPRSDATRRARVHTPRDAGRRVGRPPAGRLRTAGARSCGRAQGTRAHGRRHRRAEVFSNSSSAPHLFGDRLDDFERDLRALLEAAADDGRFAAWQGDVDLVVYRRP